MVKTAQELKHQPVSLKSLLEQHSRSFALTLFALPRQKREAVCIAYLIARLADTIADSSLSPRQDRQYGLETWKSSIFAGNYRAWRSTLPLQFKSQKEEQLVASGEEILSHFFQLSREDRSVCLRLFDELFAAMEWMLEKAPEPGSPAQFLISNQSEFDHYCYQHAGCVGQFWVEIFGLNAAHRDLAINYGKALERVNILRDVVDDYQNSVILLPKSDWNRFGFVSNQAWTEPGWSHYVQNYLQETNPYFRDAAQFCDGIPWTQWKLRWASMMPLKIALASMQLFSMEEQKQKTSKVSRAAVKSLAFESLIDTGLNRKIALRLFP